MPFSHHSHSGQFCAHAKSTLEEVVQDAIAKGFHTFALTEHIPRPIEDLYPEEVGKQQEPRDGTQVVNLIQTDRHTAESLAKLFDDFLIEAERVREAYASQIKLLIGFESEWIRPSTHQTIKSIMERYTFDFFMGSIHHCHTIPIDFDRAAYEKARDAAGGTDEQLFQDYFDEQYEMLQALKPPVVGHFDLIRLFSDHREANFKGMEGVWKRMQRNLEYIASYDGVLELNSAGLRKGLAEPYPCSSVCLAFLRQGGRFVMSDDSHGTEQVATNYPRLLQYMQRVGISEIFYVDREASPKDSRVSAGFSCITVDKLLQLPFWTRAR
ncbi:histidinol phosphate phosphatase HisJ family protein [Paraphaeosphaeria minitans]|uniref:Histidinol-phosphatase n=1 Tax=Paraphaeosphaeria minitans TaxID=565426 RepID=A0A9P6GFG0_9PLEO|nr:histidinol phosphate phosphatase HisJ family protein [Paraphaeosphaeria minitans]